MTLDHTLILIFILMVASVPFLPWAFIGIYLGRLA